jgi:hypothetical protein|tara:strand:+ start:147 stop:494 length:348 start_codon:yes stop_codon:yes gene_type:complete
MSKWAAGEIADIVQECEGSSAAAILMIADWLEDGENYTPSERKALRRELIKIGFYESYEDEKCHYQHGTIRNGKLTLVDKFGYYDKPDFIMAGTLYRQNKAMRDRLLDEHEKQFG